MPLDQVLAAAGFRNRLLAALPAAHLGRLRPYLARVTLVATQVLHEAGAVIDHVYFIESGLVALIADTGDDGQVQVDMIGRDGLAGAAVLLDPSAITLHRAIVQVPGSAYRMRAAMFRELAGEPSAFRDRCCGYVQATIREALQLAACGARHPVPARLTRLLLMIGDRMGSDELPMTQEVLSRMLGVRRAGVSVVTSALEAQGLIRQSRGHVSLLDRGGLEAQACCCHQLLGAGQERFTPVAPAAVERQRTTRIVAAPNFAGASSPTSR